MTSRKRHALHMTYAFMIASMFVTGFFFSLGVMRVWQEYPSFRAEVRQTCQRMVQRLGTLFPPYTPDRDED